jgi:hypothetical protein
MIRRILIAPLNYDHPQEGQLHAFCGIFGPDNVLEFDYMAQQRAGHSNDVITSKFVDVARKFKPDWIWMQVQGTDVLQPWGVVQIQKQLPTCAVTHWMGDARLVLPPDLQAMCRATHATFVSSVGQLPLYRAAGARRTAYVQIGLDWAEDVLGLPEWTPPFRVPEVVFLGSHYGDMFGVGATERLETVRRLRDEGFDFGVVGRGWPLDIPVIGECTVKQQHHVWKRAKVAINVNHFNNIELYYSDRQIIAMASGTPVVCRHVPGLEHEFESGTNCLWFRTLDRMTEQVRRLLADAALRHTIGAAGREEVIARHTWLSRVLGIMPAVERIREQLATRAEFLAATRK